jgi:hypothetical protein
MNISQKNIQKKEKKFGNLAQKKYTFVPIKLQSMNNDNDSIGKEEYKFIYFNRLHSYADYHYQHDRKP